MENYYGRILTQKEIPADQSNNFEKLAGMTENLSSISCNRCGSSHSKKQVQLPVGAYYCPTCINLGRVRSDEQLYYLPQIEFQKSSYLKWTGKLTEYQEEISQKLIKSVKEKSQILVHAVTGAGKTEMIYQAVDQCLKSGGAVAIATPRIDVCIELHKRMSNDFDLKIPLLHGEGKPYFRSPLIIGTTHQLLRFREAFDLLIIDEVDAFPFVDSDELYYASEHARKIDSTLIYLTATSTSKLDAQVKSGQLKKVHLARRFHGNPLVVPKNKWISSFDKHFKQQRKSGFPLLIFIPELHFGADFAKQLQEKYPNEKIDFVASTTENRLEIVEQFRNQELTILVSSTILERGVTFPKVDVFVVHAEHITFTSSSLIQIAGRVGRSFDHPTGLVYYFHEGKTKAINQSIKEIKMMNQKGFSNDLSTM